MACTKTEGCHNTMYPEYPGIIAHMLLYVLVIPSKVT